MTDLLVGFDLDMTLIDSRPGIRATYEEISRRTGVPIDADLVVTRLGPPLEIELANWFPAERIDDMVQLYRSLYAEYALPLIGPRHCHHRQERHPRSIPCGGVRLRPS